VRGGGDEMLCRASNKPGRARKLPKRKPGCLCRAFLSTIPPSSNVFAQISLARKLVKRGGTGATKMAPSKIGLGVARKGEFAEIESSGNVRHGDWREYALQGIGIPLI